MLGVTLACASLLLAAGGVGVASMPPVHNVALPSIASVYFNDTYLTGIRPVDASVAVPLDTSDYLLTVSIGDSTLELTEGMNDGETYVYVLNYTGGEVELEENSTPAEYLAGYPEVPLVTFTTSHDPAHDAGSLEISLPDLTYWHFDGSGSYFLAVSYDYGVTDNAGYYGLPVSYAEATGLTLSPVTPAELGADVNPISAIGDGLGVIPALGGGLTDGFDAVFVDNGALTAVGTFAFLLMGIGISVGIVKKCFNWVTGRHGM